MPRRSAAGASCALSVALLLSLAAWLTDGFEAWTYEALRRRDADAGRLHAPPMPLRDTAGQIRTFFDRRDIAAPVTLLNFIYTRCASVCQAQGSEYFRMQEALRSAGATRVRLLSVSIAPGEDSTPALAAYARRHRADAALWAVTAPLDEHAGRAALQRLGVVALPDGRGDYVHNGSLHLVDAAGRVRRIFDDAQWPQALSAALALSAEAAP
jgi:protein SCO1